jgi:hypothetical protein
VEVAEPMVITTLIDDEIHEAYLEIIDREDRHVVTVIEVVSPSNKVAGSRGRRSYLRKRREIMDSPAHWGEIDFLRSGTPLVPQGVLSHGDYFVHVSRSRQRPKGSVWPIRLTQRLPVVTIPLKAEDADVELDLQRVLDTAYDRAGYDMVVNYRADPEVPLSEAYAAWVDELLRSKGLR